MARTPKQIIEEESIRLIQHITEFDQDEENFEICERFVLSNLFYHKYLDPDERKINKTLQGVKEKFLIHAQFEKAKQFEELVSAFKDSELFKQPLEQHDLKHRLLSLLLNLAENPVNTDFEPTPVQQDPEEERIDWLAVLNEGELPPQPLGSESDLSIWSDDSDFEDKTEDFSSGKDPGYTVHPQKPVEDDPKEWIHRNIQFPYWNEEQKFPETAANYSSHIESVLEKRGKLDVHTEKISEFQLIREVLWMLRTPTDSPIFEFRNGEFHVTDLVTLTSVTDLAMRSLLKEILPSFSNIYSLRAFIHKIEYPGPGVQMAHTVEAYGNGLNHVLHQFSEFLLELEERISAQDTTYTVLMLLDELRPWIQKLGILRNVHDFATRDYFEEEENCYKSMRILSVLYNTVISTPHPNIIDLLMDIFLISMRPYLRILNTWLVHGSLTDDRSEFFFYKNSEDQGDVWNNVFKQRNYEAKLKQDNIRPIALFVSLADRILVSGKSNEILSKMDKLEQKGECDSSSIVLSSIYEVFITNMRSRIGKFFHSTKPSEASTVSLKGSAISDIEIESVVSDKSEQSAADFAEIVKIAEDEFLAAAFTNMFLKMEKDSDDTGVQPRCNELGVNLDPLIPLESMLTESLSVGILQHFSRSCSVLVSLFTEDLHVEEELARARLVFFMEAGDIMQDFNNQIFSIIHRKETDLLDSSSLTLLLQDCLSQRFGSWVEQFSCTYAVPNEECNSPILSLEGLSINMNISWPLNIIISPENLVMYNKIFLFLVTVKRSLWCLQSISLAEIAQLDKRMDYDETSIEQQLSDSSLTVGQKQHRLQLLRAWLLYFVTLLHGYFMSRVVHSTHLELSAGLSKATDLNILIEVHQTYLQRIHDRCFLHPGVRMLKEAISMVLSICLEVHTGVQENSIHSRSIDVWEEKYSRCHNFLSSTLNSMVRKSKLPHLEGLAAALLHSCPQQQ